MKGEIGVDDTFALLWTSCHVYIEACVANLICNNRMACKKEASILFRIFSFLVYFFTQIHSDLPWMMPLQFGDKWRGCKPEMVLWAMRHRHNHPGSPAVNEVSHLGLRSSFFCDWHFSSAILKINYVITPHVVLVRQTLHPRSSSFSFTS